MRLQSWAARSAPWYVGDRTVNRRRRERPQARGHHQTFHHSTYWGYRVTLPSPESRTLPSRNEPSSHTSQRRYLYSMCANKRRKSLVQTWKSGEGRFLRKIEEDIGDRRGWNRMMPEEFKGKQKYPNLVLTQDISNSVTPLTKTSFPSLKLTWLPGTFWFSQQISNRCSALQSPPELYSIANNSLCSPQSNLSGLCAHWLWRTLRGSHPSQTPLPTRSLGPRAWASILFMICCGSAPMRCVM